MADCCVVDETRREACAVCRPAGDLLHPDPQVRRQALARATPEDRPKVLLAFVRGGSLYEEVVVDEVDLGREIVRWLLTHRCPTLFRRWLAEDAVWGGYAWGALAEEEPDRVLQRAPVWMARERPAAEHAGSIGDAWRGQPQRWTALGLRLGSATRAPRLPPHLIDAFPALDEVWIDRGLHMGATRPSEAGWVPAPSLLDAARRWRRWPLSPTPSGVLVCTLCAEALPPEGACVWCGIDPAQEPPTDLDIHELLTQRYCCETCGLDLTRLAVPILCGGCGAPTATSPTAPAAAD